MRPDGISTYTSIKLTKEGALSDRKSIAVHLIIGYTFLGARPSDSHTIDHINRHKNDNRACNLRWADPYVQIGNREHATYRLTHINKDKEETIFCTIIEAARTLNLSPNAISFRVRHIETKGTIQLTTVDGRIQVTLMVEILDRKSFKLKRSREEPILGYGGKCKTEKKSDEIAFDLRCVCVGSCVVTVGSPREIKNIGPLIS